MDISEKLSAYLFDVKNEHDREWSWVYCYRYFKSRKPDEIRVDRDHAALNLAFYLASWGMYRPSSFLFQHAYTVHMAAIDALITPESANVWDHEFGTEDRDQTLVASVV